MQCIQKREPISLARKSVPYSKCFRHVEAITFYGKSCIAQARIQKQRAKQHIPLYSANMYAVDTSHPLNFCTYFLPEFKQQTPRVFLVFHKLLIGVQHSCGIHKSQKSCTQSQKNKRM